VRAADLLGHLLVNPDFAGDAAPARHDVGDLGEDGLCATGSRASILMCYALSSH